MRARLLFPSMPMNRPAFARTRRALLLASLLTAGAPLIAGAQTTTLLNVSYDVAREFYKDYNKAFLAQWKQTGGGDLVINQTTSTLTAGTHTITLRVDPKNLPAGFRVAAEKQAALQQAGVDPVTAAIPAAVSGMGTIGQFALPASMGSNAASLPARVASRGLQGAAINVPAGVVQRQADEAMLPSAEPVPPTRWRPEIPGWVENILLKAVSLDPAQRFETAEEFVLALEHGAYRPLTSPRRIPLAARNPSLTLKIVLGISLVLNLVLALWLSRQ